MSFSEAKGLIFKENFDLAICDYHLPDAEKGEAIECLVKSNIPTVVLTGTYDPAIREFCINLGVADVLLKNIPNLSDIILSTVKRLLKNMHTNVLVVEDSKLAQTVITKTLKSIGLNVFQAGTLAETEKLIFEKGKTFELILLDYYLEREAIDLLINLRKRYSKHEVGVIVISAYVTSIFVPQLLKAGANDFLRKPFLEEELKVRVNNLLDYLDAIRELSFLANHDPLTGLLNRKTFFTKANELFQIAKRKGLKLALVMFDLDDFKKINDTYGHQAGDLVLCDFGKKLKEWFKRQTDIIARYGGEEFVLICFYDNREEFLSYLEKFSEFIAQNPPSFKNVQLPYTFSAGVELELKENLEEMLKSADFKLYKAKSFGKIQIVY
ncbi:MAG: diguanylate cyclase [Thermodesulfobacterium sp.]|jgi:diguanylate cyclase (GGDEF)-like protein|nr:diguanylate cyclase [Thermodesulfobacterium sp.]